MDQQWTDDASLLMPAAKNGSYCSTLLLTDQGMMTPDEWVLSLEPSA